MKRLFVGGFLVAFGLWPLAHAVLTTHYGVDPWKLFGWSMYAVPGAMKTVRVTELRGDGQHRRLDFDRYSPDEQRVVDLFRERRRALGEFEPMKGLADSMLALHPGWEGVGVTVVSLELDRETALLEASREQEGYWRSGEPFVDSAAVIPAD